MKVGCVSVAVGPVWQFNIDCGQADDGNRKQAPQLAPQCTMNTAPQQLCFAADCDCCESYNAHALKPALSLLTGYSKLFYHCSGEWANWDAIKHNQFNAHKLFKYLYLYCYSHVVLECLRQTIYIICYISLYVLNVIELGGNVIILY